MTLRSGRPAYAIILLVLSALYVCATSGPFLYSLFVPNDDIERVVAALREGGTPSMEADNVVEEAKTAVGCLTRAIHVGSGFGSTIGFHLSGSRAPEQTKVSQATYVMWFQKRDKPMLIAITLYENDAGQKAYGISRAELRQLVEGYTVPLLLFGVSCFLARKRRSPVLAQ